jgi:hypothetical protein
MTFVCVLTTCYAVSMNDKAYMVRHFLASLAYRFHKAVADAPEGFDGLEPGYGIRPPLAIVYHINGVLGYGKVALETGDFDSWYHHAKLAWHGEIAAVYEMLQGMDTFLASDAAIEGERLERLLQGPLSDAMTHVGQLAMLRRIAGSPLHAENFFKAAIKAGQVTEEQPEPVSPDP